MKKLFTFFLLFVSTLAFATQDTYIKRNYKNGVQASDITVNGTSGAGFIELDHQASDAATPGSGSSDVRVFAKSKKLYTATDNGSGTVVVTEVGSGSATGINYVDNYDYESGAITGWGTYDDGAVIAPVDGKDGSPSYITAVIDGTNDIIGTYSMKIVNAGGGSAQGEGASYDFTVDDQFQSHPEMFTVEFNYDVSSGTFDYGDFTDVSDNSDLVVYVVGDPDSTAEVIQLIPFTLDGSGKFRGTFQTSSDYANYHLCLHVQSMNTAAWTMVVDNISVGPQIVNHGPAMSDWEAATTEMVLEYGSTEATNIDYYNTEVRRVGDVLQVRSKIRFDGAANSDGDMQFTIPNALTMDSTKIGLGSNLGHAVLYCNSKLWDGYIEYSSTTEVEIFRLDDSGATTAEWYGDTTAGDNIPSATALTNCDMKLRFEVPISGWSSNTRMSHDADTRNVYCKAYLSGAANHDSGSGTWDVVPFDAVAFDSHSAFDTSNHYYVVPVSGVYEIIAHPKFDNADQDGVRGTRIRKESISHADTIIFATTLDTAAISSTIDEFDAGDTIDVQAYQNSGSDPLAYVTTENDTYITIHKLSGPSAIAASEKVSFGAYLTGDQTINTVETIVFDTERWDSHSAYDHTTGIFTAPRAGICEFDVIITAEQGGTAGASMTVRGNTSLSGNRGYAYLTDLTANKTYPMNYAAKLKMDAGDTYKVEVSRSGQDWIAKSNASSDVSAFYGVCH